ncbi:NAD(P)-binding protein [Neoconidiobolus thromboides FSU 785]|nr:NAD(P)-binding protein [Neoconidiobolus thromboides FSU 785]
MKTVVITGITGAVGKGILISLLTRFTDIKIYGTARNADRVLALFEEVILNLPPIVKKAIEEGKVVLIPLELDTSDVDSISSACKKLSSSEDKIDTLFLNAGALIANGISYWGIVHQLLFDIRTFPVKPKYINHDGISMINKEISKSFYTNVYGHYIMIRKLTEVLKKSQDARIIWTGSSEGEKEFFDIEDIQGMKSINPYGSNKYCLQLLSELFNQEFKAKNYPITSIVTSPGVIASNIANTLLPPLFVMIFMTPALIIMRLLFGIPELTISLKNASASILYSFEIPLGEIDSKCRYDATSDRFGKSKVVKTKFTDFTQEDLKSLDLYLKDLDKNTL